MDSKYISLQVTGNPIANAGYQPIAWYNNPDIDIKKNDYVGFGSNSYFFVVKIKPKTTIFTIIVNRVKSYDASRQGVSLKIAFSVPRGYKFEGNISPYTVLVHLKDYFIAKCMTLQSDGYYMYNEGIVPTILDDIAKKYPLAEAKGPYHIMNEKLPIGYVIASEKDIAQLLNDVQYSIFSNYSEVVVAENVDATTYVPIVNIQIPRPKEYTIFLNNNRDKIVTDINEQITYSGDGDHKYYQNKSLSFTIKELLETKNIPNVILDEENAIIYIDTRTLKDARKVLVTIHFIPNNGSLIWIDPSEITIRNNGKIFQLNSNLEFELVGEDISYLENIDSFSVDFKNKKYKVDQLARDGYDIKAYIRETGNGLDRQHKNYPVKEIAIILKANEKIFKEQEFLLIELGLSSNGDFFLLQRTRVYFRKDRSGYKGIMYISNDLMNKRSFMRFSAYGCRFTTGHLPLEKEKIELKDNDFQEKPIPFIERHKSLLVFLLCIILGFVLGLPLGYCTHNIVNNVFNKEKSVRCPDCNQDFPTNEELEKHKNVEHSGFVCSKCGQKFDTQDYLDSHMKETHSTFSCLECGQTFSKETDLDSHMKNKHSKLKCSNCSEEFESQEDLSEHMKDAHPQVYKCGKCPEEFESQEDLSRHMKNAHPQVYKCDKCLKTFDSQKKLSAHMYEHKPHCDGSCGKTYYFNSNEDLQAHKNKFH